MLGVEVNGVISVAEAAFSAKYPISVHADGSISKLPNEAPIPQPLVDNGAIYALKPAYVREQNYFPPQTLPYYMPFWASIDVDTPQQLELAKAMYKHFILKKEEA